VYDGKKDKAIWLAVQDYFTDREAELFAPGASLNVRIPLSNRVNRQSIERLAKHKKQVHQQLRRKEPHHE
jgi:hypothetical protein